jgi:RND family efflux transporter MFP subunit
MKLSPAILACAALALIVAGAATGFALSNAMGGGAVSGAPGGPFPGGGGPGGPGYAPVVAMARVEQGAITRTVDVIGQARSLRSVALTSEVTGLVKAVNFAPGARVDMGDVLIQIDDNEQQVLLARARADFPVAQANAARYRNLQSDEAASALEAEQASNNLTAAQAQLSAAEVAVAQRKITAPFDGIAGLTEIEVGDYLRAGDVVATLDDTTSIIIDFAVPQEEAAFVDMGQKVTAALTSAAQIVYSGEITAIDSRVNPESRALKIEAQIANDEGRLIPGSVFAVSTTTPGQPAIEAPGLAIQWDRSGAFVWRRGENGLAERVSVVILQRANEMALVEGDLEPGDVIVTEGADQVRLDTPLPDLPPQTSSASVSSGNSGE